MTKKTFSLLESSALLLAGALLTFASPPPQSQPSLQITSPASGTVVGPGQTVTVTVTSPAGLTFSEVDVIGEFPIGMSTVATSVPAQILVTIPSSMAFGPRALTAEGTTASGATTQSASIMIDVERSDFPALLTASAASLTLESQGQMIPFTLFAKFSDGTVIRANESSYVTYTSSNSAVAMVDTSGEVTAVGPGDAFIVAKYALGSMTNQISIPVTVQRAMLTPSPSSLTFPNQSLGTASQPQQLTLANSSSGTLNILSVNATGDFSETDNCVASSPLGTSGICTVNVTFSPTAAGTRTGTLNVANSANVIPVSIPLSGTGTTAPAITGLNPNSGAVGSSVTITGVNFGTTQGTSSVTFNGTAATPTSWSGTSIVAPVPSGATSGNVVVTVGGVASNGVNFTVTAPPAIAWSPTAWNTTGTRGCTGTGSSGCPEALFTLTNSGSSTVTGVATPTITGSSDFHLQLATANKRVCGPNAPPTGVSVTTLSPGQSCAVGVIFEPTTADVVGSVLTATLSVTDSAGTQTVTVSGTVQ